MSTATTDELLDKIGTLYAREKETKRALESTVAAARLSGCSWSLIGSAMGISRQAATERFGRLSAVVNDA